MGYSDFRSKVNGTVVGDGQCVSLVVNNSRAYIEYLYPGVNWTTIIKPLVSPNDGAKELAKSGAVNASYLQWIANDHNNPNQVPAQGAIMVFGATPASGYSNTYSNPYGHTGVCDSADSTGYNLLSQQIGQLTRIQFSAWKFRPCLGWYQPLAPGTAPAPAPASPPVVPPPAPTGRTIFLPATTGPWHLYNNDGPYVPQYAKATIVPSQYGGLTYNIVADKGNGVYVINTQMFGQGALWTKGSDVVIK